MKEVWKDIKGYEGLYKISNNGKIASAPRRGNGNNFTILRPFKNADGYLVVGLSKFGFLKKISLHRLIAESYIPNPDNKPEVDHINGIRDDNRINNLRWTTKIENVNNPITKKRVIARNGEKSTPVSQYTLAGVFLESYISIREAERLTGVGNGNISNCCNGKNKTAGGYIWRKG